MYWIWNLCFRALLVITGQWGRSVNPGDLHCCQHFHKAEWLFTMPGYKSRAVVSCKKPVQFYRTLKNIGTYLKGKHILSWVLIWAFMAHCYLCKEHNHVHLLVFCLAVVCLCFCLFVFNHDYGKNLIAGTLNNISTTWKKRW